MPGKIKKQIIIKQHPSEIIDHISESIPCSKIVATLLANRGIIDKHQLLKFIHSSVQNLQSPFGLKDIDLAVKRIIHALEKNENILIFGDYDVDGITATSMLLEFFKLLGMKIPEFYIPDRLKEGYGLQVYHVQNIAVPKHIHLIITVDNGSSSVDAVRYSKQLGIDVIITDHHEMPEVIPDAVAIVNPKQKECQSGLHYLSGAGVAFYLIIALRKALRDKDFWKYSKEPSLTSFYDLVALGTMADIVPLISENRILTLAGLQNIRQKNTRIGVDALLDVSKTKAEFTSSSDLVFKLAPRLNAAGRMAHARLAVELMTTWDTLKARDIADSLNQLNMQRKNYQEKILKEIREYLEIKQPRLLNKRTIVLASAGWHPGVVGIVASQLVELYARPVVLVSCEGADGRGSARSISGVSMYKALAACKHHFEKFGGHEMAGGFTIKTKNLSMFQSEFENFVRQHTAPEHFIPKCVVDYELNFSDITPSFIEDIEKLEPFGAHNPEPLFLTKSIRVEESVIVLGRHRKMVLSQEGSHFKNAMQFNCDNINDTSQQFEHVIFHLSWDRWKHEKKPLLILADAQSTSTDLSSLNIC
ncbi:MAG: single-stranded-DNA-specific exonuclease RecJ [Desulfobacterales bacterium]|nr:single-stranded-DNA-specific exonuclease RecJ [Desulfobacterales bacterium]